MVFDGLIGKVLDKKYHIERELGKGGMGAVYFAKHLGTHRLVAVKVIAPQYMENSQFVERFRREAIATGRLRHPNIVNVTDFGFAEMESRRIAYLAMEYLDGCCLSDFLKKNAKPSLALIVDIMEQVCMGLDHAHQKGVLHRDLKPHNIWLEPNRRGGYNVKVLDFGLAKLKEIVKPSMQKIQEISPSAPTKLLDEENLSSLQGIQETWLENVDQASEVDQAFIEGDTTSVTAQIFSAEEHIDTMSATVEISSEEHVDTTSATVEISSEEHVDTTGATEMQISDQNFVVNAELTGVGTVLGTPLYMSPEQCAGKRVDLRSDIYTLGVILYQMLSGELPFSGESVNLIWKHIYQKPPCIHKKRRDLPVALSNFVMLTLSKSAADRPKNCKAFAVKLRTILEGENPIIQRATRIVEQHRFRFFLLSATIYTPFIILADILALYTGIFLLPFLLLLFANHVHHAIYSSIFDKSREKLKICTKSIIFAFLRQHLFSLFSTWLWSLFYLFFDFIKFFLPFFKTANNYCLYPQVLALENKSSKEALERSETLVTNLRYPAVSIQIYNFLSCVLITLTSILLTRRIYKLGYLQSSPNFLLYTLLLFGSILPILIGGFNAIIGIAYTLYYLKARQAIGEVPHIFDEELVEAEVFRASLWPKTLGLSILFILKRLLIIFLGCGPLVLFAFFLTHVSDRYDIVAAASRGDTEMIHKQIQKGADINRRNGFGKTALIAAIQSGRSGVAKMLLKKGADVNIPDLMGDTPLTAATKERDYDLVKLLLQYKADPNIRDKNGNTALITSAFRGHTKIVELLLKSNVQIDLKARCGRTAWEIARDKKYHKIMKMIAEKKKYQN